MTVRSVRQWRTKSWVFGFQGNLQKTLSQQPRFTHVFRERITFSEKVIIPCTAELMMDKISPTSPSATVTLDNRQEKRESKQTTGDQKTTRSRSLTINHNMTLKLGSSYKEQRVERELLRADGNAFPGDINTDECISFLSTVHGSAYLNSMNNWKEL